MHFDFVLNEIGKIKDKYGSIEKIVLFGSRARGDFKMTSDIDLCIFGNEITKKQFPLIALEIDDIETYLSFDILFFDSINNPRLKQKILEEGVVIS